MYVSSPAGSRTRQRVAQREGGVGEGRTAHRPVEVVREGLVAGEEGIVVGGEALGVAERVARLVELGEDVGHCEDVCLVSESS